MEDKVDQLTLEQAVLARLVCLEKVGQILVQFAAHGIIDSNRQAAIEIAFVDLTADETVPKHVS